MIVQMLRREILLWQQHRNQKSKSAFAKPIVTFLGACVADCAVSGSADLAGDGDEGGIAQGEAVSLAPNPNGFNCH